MKARILGVVGSLKAQSVSRFAVRHVLDAAKRLDAEVDFIDLKTHPLPIFDPDHRQSPQLEKILKQVNWANAYVLGTPDYHGGMSGAMKNFLDYFWKEFAGKLFGYVCASHEKGLTVMDQMRTTVRQCYGWSLPYGVSLLDDDVDLKSQKITNDRVAARLNFLARDLATYAPLIHQQFTADLSSENPDAGFAVHYRRHFAKKKS